MPLRKVLPNNSDPSIHRSLSVINSTLQVVKAKPGVVVGGYVFNNHATDPRFLKIYNAVSGTVGTGTPAYTMRVNAGQTLNIAELLDPGKSFDTGICVGASTALADADTGAPAAGDVVLHLHFV